MALTGAQRVERHRQGQRARITDLEAENERLRAELANVKPTISIPAPSKKRRASAYEGMEHGGYGPTRLANNKGEAFAFDSFLAGVGAAIAMFESGKKWYLHEDSIEKAMRLLLANVNATGEISQVHAGLSLEVASYLDSWAKERAG